MSRKMTVALAIAAGSVLIGGAVGAAALSTDDANSHSPKEQVQMPSNSATEPGDDGDLEEPLIDGPVPLSREDFARDAGPDKNTVDGPMIPIGPPASEGQNVVSESTEK